MKKTQKFLIIVLLILLFSSLTYADCSYLNNATAYYSFDINANDISNNGYNATSITADNVAGLLNNAYSFDGISDSIYFGTYNILPSGDFTVNMFVNSEKTFASNNYQVLYLLKNTASNNQLFIAMDESSGNIRVKWGFRNSGFIAYTIDYPTIKNNWVMFTFEYTGGTATNINSYNFYINGVLYTTGKTLIGSGGSNSENIIGKDSVSGGYYDGLIDEISIYDYQLSTNELDDLYNGGDACNPYLLSSPLLTLSTTIINNSKQGFLAYPTGTYNFNVSAVSENTNDLVNLTFLVNGSLYDTLENINISNPNELSYNFTGIEESKNFNITITNNNATDSISYNLYFDGINPEINLTGFNNNTVFYKDYNINLNYTANAGDSNLYAINFTVIKPDGTKLNQNFTQSISGNTFSYNYFYNLNNSAVGNYTVFLEAWDDHTAKEINWKVNPEKIEKDKKIVYDTISIYTDENINSFDTKKIKEDRYNFEFDFKDKKNTYTLYIESNEKLETRNSQYKGHLVDFKNNKWIDFEGDHNIKLTKINENKYKIEVSKKDSKNTDTKFIFNSIGDLNYQSEKYYFNVSESHYIIVKDIETNETINQTTITMITRPPESPLTFSTNNGLLVIPIVDNKNYFFTLEADEYLSQNEYINFTPNGYNIIYMNKTNAFKVYIRNQLNLNLITQTVNLEFIPDLTNQSNNYTTTTGIKYISNLLPDNYIIRYKSDDYSNAYYYFTLVNGTNIEFTIYMLPSNESDEVTAQVVDEINKEVDGAYIHVQKYDLNTNSYKTVEIVKTNFEGKSIIHVQKNEEFYKFLIYYNGELKKEINPTYIYENEITFQIKLSDTILEDFFNSLDIYYKLDYNPDTQNMRFTYSDSNNIISKGIFRVSYYENNKLYSYDSEELEATAGTILINLVNVSGRTYKGQGYILLDGKEYLLAEGFYNFPKEDQTVNLGNSGLFYVLLLTIVFMVIAFYYIIISIILTPISLLLSSMLGFILIPVYVTIPIQILAIIIAIIINKR